MATTNAFLPQQTTAKISVPVDVYGVPTADPQPTTAVPDTNPPTAQIGETYNPADGTFTLPTASTQSLGLISRILSALNPFSSSK